MPARKTQRHDVVVAGGGDDDGSFDALLAADFGEVDGGGRRTEERGDIGGRVGLRLDESVEEADDFGEGAHAEDIDAGDERGLRGVVGGEDDAGAAAVAGEGGERDRALDGSETAVERELTREEEASVVKSRGDRG